MLLGGYMGTYQWVEVLAVLILGTANVAVETQGWSKGVVIGFGVVFWTACFIWGWRHLPHYLEDRGFARPREEGWAFFLLGCGLGVAALFLGGAFLGNLPLKMSFFWVVPLYVPWALAQQFFLCGVVLRFLRKLFPVSLAVCLSALLFSLSHLPDIPLALLTLVAGTFWASAFVRLKSIYPIALAHAVFGALTYYLILGQDLGQELLRLAGFTG